MEWIALLFSARGRINRIMYWIADVIFGVALLLAYIFGMWVAEKEMSALQDRLFYIGAIIVALTFAYSASVIAIKRFHDRDKSGWWVVPLVLLPSPPSDVVARFTSEQLSWIWQTIAGAVLLWAFFELGFLPGTQGPNRYGNVPLADSK